MIPASKATAISKIQNQLSLIDSINHTNPQSEQFKKWKKDSEIILDNLFGNGSRQMKEFVNIKYVPSIRFLGNSTDDQAQVEYFIRGLNEAKHLLQFYLKEIKDYGYDNESNHNIAANVDDIVELKPNFFGLGVNLNALFRKAFRKR